MDYQIGIRLDPSDQRPLYQQIVDQLVQRIHNGALPVGHRLPPTRALAEELHTHRNTVVRAFDELSAMGLTESTVGRGTFVAALPDPTDTPALERPAPGLTWSSVISKRLDTERLSRHDRLARSVRHTDAINMQRMQPSLDLLPVDSFRRCMDHVLKNVGAAALAYAPVDGLPALRSEIALSLSREGVPARAEDVMITSGSQQALDLVSRALIDPGDPVLLEDQSYSGAISLFAAAGASLIAVRGDEEGPDLRALSLLSRRGVKLFYLMPNCRNPTGGTISAVRREGLVKWARSSGVPVLEDDYGADLVLDGTPPPAAMRALDPDVLYVGTFSKKLIPALRIGYLVAPPGIRSRLMGLKHAADLGSSLLLQHALTEFLQRGYLRSHLRTVLPEYRARRDALEESLKEHLPEGVEWRHAERGVTLWLMLPPGTDVEAVFRAAERSGVLVNPGVLSSVGDDGVAGIRLTFCAESPERLREGAKRLGKALEEALGQKRTRASTMGVV